MKNFALPHFVVACLFSILVQDVLSQDINTAISEGNLELTRQILEKDPGILNLKNTEQLTPLNLAASEGQTEIARLLLSKGADPTIGDNENSQPVHLAAVNGHIQVMDLLLDHHVDINAKDDNLMTPLLFAASRGQWEMARHLVDRGADIKAKTVNGFNVLLMASISGNAEMVKYFVEKGIPVNSKNSTGFTPLHSAASYGRTDVVSYLLEKGADIEAATNEGDQPLAMAVGRNSLEAATMLIGKGADVNHKNLEGFTALHNAAGRGNLAVAGLFIESGADLNAATPNGFVPLTYASFADNALEMAKLLILSGADVNPDPCKNNKACTCGPNFRTPLHAACETGKADLVKLLIDNGARINLYNSEGLTPLHSAVKSGNIDAVRYLIDHGAFLNVSETRNGYTELHMAAFLGYGDIASLLAEKGSDMSMKDYAGKTPLDYAFYYDQQRIGYDFLAAGAADSNLSRYLSRECLLARREKPGEAEVWFLGHSGWAIKTENHLLIFDYFDNPRGRVPDHACLNSGCIDPAELAGNNVDVFSSHGHPDHYNKSYFDWDDNNDAINYIFCHQPPGITDDYNYLEANTENKIDGMNIYTIKSTDGGGGFLVDVDGLVIFFMGDHANGDDELSAAFTHEIGLVAEKAKKIDLLFGPIRGCSLGNPEQVKAGIYYTLETLHPALFIPMHSGSYTLENKLFAEQAHRDGVRQAMKYAITKGDRFHYVKGEEMVQSK